MNLVNHNPDVLSCLANLSSDEVFTSPSLVNDMLDRLPSNLWSNKDARFLDPACKSGVFLREIAKRLIVGLKNDFPNLQERLNHIFEKQLFGLAITNITALISRRSLYCSKNADSKFSVCSVFDNRKDGNIYFKNIPHDLNDEGTCKYCPAGYSLINRANGTENHAYIFTHNALNQFIKNMKFDVIIGNPPYQLKDGGASASAAPIYQDFITQAIKLNPDYLLMIVPSRWFSGGKHLDNFRKRMLFDKRMREINDFPNSSECFNGVDIKGGVNYFLWQKDYSGDCTFRTYRNGICISELKRPLIEEGMDILIRYNEAINILRKVRLKKEESFSELVSSRKPFGFDTKYRGKNESELMKMDSTKQIVKLYQTKGIGYVYLDDIPKNTDLVNEHKILVPKAIGSGDNETDKVKSIYSTPMSACTETYLVIGPFDSEEICKNVQSYINTKFFHFLLTLKKITQDATSKTYSLIPQQDFSISWTDSELYKKYSFTEDEIDYIETTIPTISE